MNNLALWFRVRAVAYGFRDFTEQPPASNRGQVVDRFTTFTGYAAKDAVPWCACFVYYAGWHGLFDPVSGKSAWPIPKTGGCAQIGEFAERRNVLRSPEEAQVGDVFLVWYVFRNKQGAVTGERFAHTGFLVHRNSDGSWITLEGNTSKPGDTDPATAREGWGVFQRVRTLKAKDRAIRWTDLV